ncbi:hypothetical protein HYU89_01855 [Candidatus Collierbacteria bacterium]|nr:hypothetical protein [Candidatus Collierbacteria bacterium]
MFAHLIRSCLHLFTPRHSNNHRPKIFHPKSLVVLAAMVVGLNSGIRPLAGFSGGVLGYASDIQITQVFEQINSQRVEAGLPGLKLNDKLSEAARRKASDMFVSDYWAHVNPITGREPWYFFDAVGYDYRYAGENMARDFSTTAPMIKAWMNSTTHRDNIVSSRYQETGIAVVNGVLNGVETTLVIQLFGTKKTAVAAVPQITSTGLQAESLAKAPAVLPAETEKTSVAVRSPLVSPFDLSKSLALATLGLLAVVLMVDSVIIWRRRIPRLVGHNWAHLMFLIALTGVVSIMSQGVIQ